MKKLCLLVIVCASVLLTGCGNENIGWGEYNYYYVTCDGSVKFRNEPITSWKDFDGEQIEITLSSGNTILVSANYCTLSKNQIADENVGE